MDKDTANLIWDALVQTCQADERGRSDFVIFAMTQTFTEYRFQGALGFGGKVWNKRTKRDHYCVDCYPEDFNAERGVMIAKANEKLKAIS